MEESFDEGSLEYMDIEKEEERQVCSSHVLLITTITITMTMTMTTTMTMTLTIIIIIIIIIIVIIIIIIIVTIARYIDICLYYNLFTTIKS